jgi:large subunit ribosomal protein L19
VVKSSYTFLRTHMAFSPIIEERKNLDMRVGDTVQVSQKIMEKGKTRLQVYEGLVIARKHGSSAGATFTVRRVAGGFGMEKIFPLYSPMIGDIKVVRRSKVRRAKLYFIREKAAKEISKRMKMEMVDIRLEVQNKVKAKEAAEQEKDEAPAPEKAAE